MAQIKETHRYYFRFRLFKLLRLTYSRTIYRVREVSGETEVRG